MNGSAAEDVAEPGPCINPFLASQADSDAESRRDLLVPQAGELAQFDDAGGATGPLAVPASVVPRAPMRRQVNHRPSVGY
jgi:hypothetical protein